jgi:hypothetical protein
MHNQVGRSETIPSSHLADLRVTTRCQLCCLGSCPASRNVPSLQLCTGLSQLVWAGQTFRTQFSLSWDDNKCTNYDKFYFILYVQNTGSVWCRFMCENKVYKDVTKTTSVYKEFTPKLHSLENNWCTLPAYISELYSSTRQPTIVDWSGYTESSKNWISFVSTNQKYANSYNRSKLKSSSQIDLDSGKFNGVFIF